MSASCFRSRGRRPPAYAAAACAATAVALVLSSASAAGPAGAVKGPLNVKVTAELRLPADKYLREGHHLPYLKVVIRNSDPGRRTAPAALILRGVHWADYPEDRRSWRRPLFGISVKQKDGPVEFTSGSAIAHTLDSRPKTDAQFETGFIPVNGELEVTVPLTPQGAGKHDLVVRFIEIPAGGRGAVWLPRKVDEWRMVFAPHDPRKPRPGKPGAKGLALIPGPAPATTAIRQVVLSMKLPMVRDLPRLDPSTAQAELAARAAGIGALDADHRKYYLEPLRSWFFVWPDGKAVAVQRVVDTAAHIDPEAPAPGEKWQKRALPKMAPTAPEHFCRLKDGATGMCLRPDVFGDLVTVKTATARHDPGTTTVPPAKFWAVLDRARERAIALRLAAFDPHGFGVRRLLTLGVIFDASGRRPDPSVPRYLESPRQAVDVIRDLLHKEDWTTLSTFYDLSGTEVKRSDLVSGAFFIRTKRPESAHPAGFWRYKHPFPPAFTYVEHKQSEKRGAGVYEVTVSVTIDQGADEPPQRSVKAFLMRKSERGWQVLPGEVK